MNKKKLLFGVKIILTSILCLYLLVSFYFQINSISNLGWWYSLGVALGCFYPFYCALFNKDMDVGYLVLKCNDRNNHIILFRWFLALSAICFLYFIPQVLDQWIIENTKNQ